MIFPLVVCLLACTTSLARDNLRAGRNERANTDWGTKFESDVEAFNYMTSMGLSTRFASILMDSRTNGEQFSRGRIRKIMVETEDFRRRANAQKKYRDTLKKEVTTEEYIDTVLNQPPLTGELSPSTDNDNLSQGRRLPVYYDEYEGDFFSSSQIWGGSGGTYFDDSLFTNGGITRICATFGFKEEHQVITKLEIKYAGTVKAHGQGDSHFTHCEFFQGGQGIVGVQVNSGTRVDMIKLLVEQPTSHATEWLSFPPENNLGQYAEAPDWNSWFSPHLRWCLFPPCSEEWEHVVSFHGTAASQLDSIGVNVGPYAVIGYWKSIYKCRNTAECKHTVEMCTSSTSTQSVTTSEEWSYGLEQEISVGLNLVVWELGSATKFEHNYAKSVSQTVSNSWQTSRCDTTEVKCNDDLYQWVIRARVGNAQTITETSAWICVLPDERVCCPPGTFTDHGFDSDIRAKPDICDKLPDIPDPDTICNTDI